MGHAAQYNASHTWYLRKNCKIGVPRNAFTFFNNMRYGTTKGTSVLEGTSLHKRLNSVILKMTQVTNEMQISLFHRAFRFIKFYLHQRMHLFLSYTKIT